MNVHLGIFFSKDSNDYVNILQEAKRLKHELPANQSDWTDTDYQKAAQHKKLKKF